MMIGPAPTMRTEWMSVRFGIFSREMKLETGHFESRKFNCFGTGLRPAWLQAWAVIGSGSDYYANWYPKRCRQCPNMLRKRADPADAAARESKELRRNNDKL